MGDEGMKKWLAVLFLAALTLLVFPKTTITLRHAMSGQNLKALEDIVKAFNETHPDIEVVPVFTGSYAETLTKAIAAYRNNTHPHIVQVYEVRLQTMLDSGAIVPVYEIAEPNFDSGGHRCSDTQLLLCGWKTLLDAIQLVNSDTLLQQGHLPESGIRPQQATHDL